MKSVAWPVSKPGASKSMFLTSSRPGVPIGWTVSELALGTTRPCSSPSRDVTAAAIRNRIRPAWVNSVAILVYWWRSPYRKRVPSASVASRTCSPFRRRTARTPSAETPDIAARSGRRGSKNGSGLVDPDLGHAAPQLGRPIERADDDRDDQDHEPGAEPRRAEDGEDAQPLHDVHDARAQDRVVAGVQVVERRRVVGRRAEGEVGQLLDRHPDDREQGQDDDLGDGEVDRGQQAP